jgi:hypothetical protein
MRKEEIRASGKLETRLEQFARKKNARWRHLARLQGKAPKLRVRRDVTDDGANRDDFIFVAR